VPPFGWLVGPSDAGNDGQLPSLAFCFPSGLIG